jgi:ABC-2 type transport system permease protein
MAGFFMMNHWLLGEHIRNGTLDFYIVKPVSLQFIATLSRSELSLFVTDIIPGTIMVIVGMTRLNIGVDVFGLIGFLGLMMSSVIVGYSLLLFPVITTFWFVKADAVAGATGAFWDFNNMPMTIYSKTVQRIGIFVLPIFVIVNFPTLFIMGKMEPMYAVWGVVAPVVCFTATRLFWKIAVRRYSSASS